MYHGHGYQIGLQPTGGRLRMDRNRRRDTQESSIGGHRRVFLRWKSSSVRSLHQCSTVEAKDRRGREWDDLVPGPELPDEKEGDRVVVSSSLRQIIQTSSGSETTGRDATSLTNARLAQ